MKRPTMVPRAVMLSAFVLFACGGGGQPATTVVTSASVAATTTTAAESVGSTSPITTAATTTAAAEATTTSAVAASDCPEPSAPPSGWRFLQTQNWKIFHPGDWQDATADAPPATAEIHFDDATISEAGIDGSEQLLSYVLVGPGNLPVLVLTHLEETTSSLQEIYQRAEDRYTQSSDFEELLDAGVAECLGGEPAMRVDFTFGGGFFQQSWFSLHDGKLFHADFIAPSADDASVAAEIFRTWEWIEPLDLAPTGDAFVQVDMATDIDTSATEPDPSWFADTFTTQTSTIYAVFQLQPGTSGQIEAIWTHEGENVLSYDFFYQPTDTWGYVGMTDGGGDFPTGDYQVVISLDDDVARAVLDFSVIES